MAWNPPSTFVAGVAAGFTAKVNQLLESLLALYAVVGDGTWTTFSPSWSGTIGNGVITARFQQVGSTVNWAVDITAGSTTNFASGTTLVLPVARGSGKRIMFVGVARIGSSSFPIYGDAGATSSTLTLRADATTAGNALRNISASIPGTFATGDTLSISGSYEAS